MRWSRRSFAKATSVLLFPRPRMRAMTSDRFALVKTSAMLRRGRGGRLHRHLKVGKGNKLRLGALAA